MELEQDVIHQDNLFVIVLNQQLEIHTEAAQNLLRLYVNQDHVEEMPIAM